MQSPAQRADLPRQQRRAIERSVRKAARKRPHLATGAFAVGALLASGPATAATFTVANLNDSGLGSLRDAITQANTTPGADTITFQAGLTGTITLTSGELAINESLTVNGPGEGVITVSGNGSSAIFNSENAASTTPETVDINNLTLTGGAGSAGGAIHDADDTGIDRRFIYLNDPLYVLAADGEAHAYPLEVFLKAWKETSMDTALRLPERSAIVPSAALGASLPNAAVQPTGPR